MRYYAIYRSSIDEFSSEYGNEQCVLGAEMTYEELKQAFRTAIAYGTPYDAYCIMDETGDDDEIVPIPEDWWQ